MSLFKFFYVFVNFFDIVLEMNKMNVFVNDENKIMEVKIDNCVI